MIGDRAYESDPLDAELRCLGIEMMALHLLKDRVVEPKGTGAKE